VERKTFPKKDYIYTNLKDCSFDWKMVKIRFGDSQKEQILTSGTIESPDVEPGETKALKIDCSDSIQDADLFLFTATDHNGMEIYTWSWPIKQPIEKAAELIEMLSSSDSEVKIEENHGFSQC